jgi:hypothetical protein
MKNGVMEITPEIAKDLLGDDNDHQRHKSVSHVAFLANEMESGRWQMNGEPIIVSNTGRVLDGQHRLTACIKCGKSFKTIVVSGVPDECFKTIDTGMKRTTGNILQMAGVPNANAMAAGMLWFWKYRLARQRQGSMNMCDKPSSKEILDMVQKDMDMCGRAMSVVTIANHTHKSLTRSTGIGLYLAFSKYDNEARASEFFGKLASGANLEDGNPILTLKNKMSSLYSERDNDGKLQIMKSTTLKDQVKAAYICIAYNRYKNGLPLSLLRWTEGRDKFPFV